MTKYACAIGWGVRISVFRAMTLGLACCSFVGAVQAQQIGAAPPTASSAKVESNNTDSANSAVAESLDEEPDPEAFASRDAQRFYERVFRRLKRMKPYEAKKVKSDDDAPDYQNLTGSSDAKSPAESDGTNAVADSFVIGTAAVHPVTQNADVCFRATSGIDKTAREVTRVHGETIARGEISHWHVFYRVGAGDSSQQLVAQLQKKYDETVAYRNQLMLQYNARTIRRC